MSGLRCTILDVHSGWKGRFNVMKQSNQTVVVVVSYSKTPIDTRTVSRTSKHIVCISIIFRKNNYDYFLPSPVKNSSWLSQRGTLLCSPLLPLPVLLVLRQAKFWASGRTAPLQHGHASYTTVVQVVHYN